MIAENCCCKCVHSKNSWSKRHILRLTVIVTTFGILYVLSVRYNSVNRNAQSTRASSLSSSSQANHETVPSLPKFVVDTPTCKIPEMDPMDPSIRNFLEPDYRFQGNCTESHRAWVYLNGTTLRINGTAVHESGYSLNSIYCCYRIISHVEQPLVDDFQMDGNDYVSYSKKCQPIRNGIAEVDAEFIRVHCISKAFPLLNDVIYRDFFAIATGERDRHVSHKLLDWRRKFASSGLAPPPNVIIIGIDTNSRMNTHRYLKSTVKVLQNLGAVELLGYTKVHDNTFPNVVPFLGGYSYSELVELCYHERVDPLDDCPFIWKAFDDLGYITAHVEDTPYFGFNFRRTGFLRKPTDFYLRPLMLAVMTYLPRINKHHTTCIGRYMTDEFMFNYILDIIQMSKSNAAPVFAFSFLTSLAHLNYNNAQFGDKSIASFIQRLIQISDDNTIFFFVSDHGPRYGPIRETTQGWYEDKLPTNWVYIPQTLRKKFPSWYESLQKNVNRLTSHFDLFKTMVHILQSYDPYQRTTPFRNMTNLKKGQSLFQEVPEIRTCADAGIPVSYCACTKPKPIDIGSPEVIRMASNAVKHLTTLVPPDLCAIPTLKSIANAGYLSIRSKEIYVISVITSPGDFLFEVHLEQDASSGNYLVVSDFHRLNKMTKNADCVDSSLMQTYCYCK